MDNNKAKESLLKSIKESSSFQSEIAINKAFNLGVHHGLDVALAMFEKALENQDAINDIETSRFVKYMGLITEKLKEYQLQGEM